MISRSLHRRKKNFRFGGCFVTAENILAEHRLQLPVASLDAARLIIPTNF